LRVPEQIRRIAVATGLIAVVVIAGRFVVIPRSYFSHAAHVDSTIVREAAKPIAFAGAALCAECHTDIDQVKSASYHRGLACETCHGPSVKHTEDPESVKPYAPRDRAFCPVCHAYDAARPTGFPQIDPAAHNPGPPCITCHNPHDPVPPETPRECSACHAQIAHTKAVSAHARVPCTTCHEVKDQHRVDPRSALPTKPRTRDFCGTCHAQGAANAQAPKIDLAAHHPPHLCWQCHYPHLPEGR
jgi:hypothetical protein